MRRLRRARRNIQCAGRQPLTGRSCAQMIGSTRRWGVGGEHRHERAIRRHRPMATRRTATADRRSSRSRTAATRFVPDRRIAPDCRPASLRIVWTCVRYAASVQYQRVTLSDLSAAAGVSERRVRDAFCECHGMSPTAYLRVAALLEVRRALLDGPFSTRSCNPRRVGLRVLAPRPLCRPVPSVVRRITQRDRRTRQDACRIRRAWAGEVLRRSTVAFLPHE